MDLGKFSRERIESQNGWLVANCSSRYSFMFLVEVTTVGVVSLSVANVIRYLPASAAFSGDSSHFVPPLIATQEIRWTGEGASVAYTRIFGYAKGLPSRSRICECLEKK